MSTALDTYVPPQLDAKDPVVGWALMLGNVEQLSRVIAPTDFVPVSLRGKPAAVGACVLAGLEIGIGPMTALQHLHIIEGRPSMSAQLMRALVLAHGHMIRPRELTTTRCVVIGRRRDDDGDPIEVTWTMEDARRQELDRRPNWRKMPRQMLFARATADLCRAIFPDVIGGMTLAVEEALDQEGAELNGAELPELAPPRATKTVQRRRTKTAPEAEESSATPPPPPQPEEVIAEPPLPGDEAEQPLPSHTEAERPAAAQDEPSPAPERPLAQGGPASQPQLRNVFALLRQLGRDDPRELRLATVQGLLSRPVATMADVTSSEAAALIDTLTRVTQAGDPEAYLEWLVDAGQQVLDDHLINAEDADVLAFEQDAEADAEADGRLL